jgi:hypothetical protein
VTLSERFKRLSIWNKLGVIASIVGILAFILTVITLAIPQRALPPNPAGSKSVESDTVGWLPPELPPGCSNIIVRFGDQPFFVPIWEAEFPPDETAVQYHIRDLPPELRNTFPARMKYVFIRSTPGGSGTVVFPFQPFVISNRFFMYVEIPFLDKKRKILMSDDMDSQLTQLPDSWDYNYSANSNVFEIVNGHTNPVLQVIYKSANDIQVNGVFFSFDGKTNRISKAFPGIQSPFYVVFPSLDTQTLQQVSASNLNRPQAPAFVHIATDSVYDWATPTQKAIFKYPANFYPGVFAK